MTSKIVVEGDSTAKGGTNGARWDLWLSMMLKRPITNNAVWGSWTAQVKDRLKTNVLDLHPEYCILLMGTNDICGNENRKTSLQNYEDIVDELINNSIKPIVCAVLPRNDFPELNATIRIFNNCLLHMCNVKGIPFVDLYNPLAKGSDPVADNNGKPIDYILNADNLHWSTYGAILGAKEIAKVFKVYSQSNADYPHNLFKGDYPLLENGIFTADTTSDGLADGWEKTGITTAKLENNPNGGKYQVIDKTGSTQETVSFRKVKFGGLTQNATYKFQCDFEFILKDKTDTNASALINFEFFNAQGESLGNSTVDKIWYATSIPMTDIYHEFTPPAGTSTVTLSFNCTATSAFTMKVGRAYINVVK